MKRASPRRLALFIHKPTRLSCQCAHGFDTSGQGGYGVFDVGFVFDDGHAIKAALRSVDTLLNLGYIAIRRAETLTESEHAELLHLTNQVEKYYTERLKYLTELACIRKISLTELLDELGLNQPIHKL